MYRFTIAEPNNGYEVYVNLISSAAGRYLSRQPHLINLIKEVLAPMKLKGGDVLIEHDMGRRIGNTDTVKTDEKDTIFYAQPYKKVVFSRYVKNRAPIPSSKLTIILVRDDEGNYDIVDTWVGQYTPPFPGDEKETDQSKPFWETHAVVMDTQVVQSKTITKTCPY
jgi:hypothetical protein